MTTKSLAVVGPGYAMSGEERAQRSLDGTMPAHIPTLSVGKIDNVSRARIRRAFAELCQGNIAQVEAWMHEVAVGSFHDGKMVRAEPRAGDAALHRVGKVHDAAGQGDSAGRARVGKTPAPPEHGGATCNRE
jgi:hypothetical protein